LADANSDITVTNLADNVTIADTIAGSGLGITKLGAGTLTLTNANTYDGGTTIDAGRVVIGGTTGLLGANTAANAVLINANGTLQFGRSGGPWVHTITGVGNIEVSATTVTYSGDLTGFTGDVTVLSSGRFALGSNNSGSAAAAWKIDGILSLSGTRTISLGELSGSGEIFTGAGINSPVNTFIVGGLNTDSTFSGTIGFPSNDGINLTKTGTGVLTLNGNNTYNGVTNINNGTLLVDGTHTVAAAGVPGLYTVASGATLGGSGSTESNVTVLSNGKLAPGDSLNPGNFGTGNLLLSSGSIFEVNLNGLNAGTEYDQVDVTGTVNITDSLLDIILGFSPSVLDTFTIINNNLNDAVIGTFLGKPEGSLFVDDGQNWIISYVGGDGNDVVLTAVPEPSTSVSACLALLGLGLVVYREMRRSRNRAA
jgi:autotransporter-associated beta strand protein